MPPCVAGRPGRRPAQGVQRQAIRLLGQPHSWRGGRRVRRLPRSSRRAVRDARLPSRHGGRRVRPDGECSAALRRASRDRDEDPRRTAGLDEGTRSVGRSGSRSRPEGRLPVIDRRAQRRVRLRPSRPAPTTRSGGTARRRGARQDPFRVQSTVMAPGSPGARSRGRRGSVPPRPGSQPSARPCGRVQQARAALGHRRAEKRKSAPAAERSSAGSPRTCAPPWSGTRESRGNARAPTA